MLASADLVRSYVLSAEEAARPAAFLLHAVSLEAERDHWTEEQKSDVFVQALNILASLRPGGNLQH